MVTVNGTNLPQTVAFAIEYVVCYGDYSRSSTSVSQTCTAQTGTPSYVGLTVKDQAGGTALQGGSKDYYFSISDAVPVVTGRSPWTLTRNVPTRVTVMGANLPSTVAFAINSVVCNGDYVRSSTSVSQTCTAQTGTPSSVGLVVKDYAGGNLLSGGANDFTFSVQ